MQVHNNTDVVARIIHSFILDLDDLALTSPESQDLVHKHEIKLS